MRFVFVLCFGLFDAYMDALLFWWFLAYLEFLVVWISWVFCVCYLVILHLFVNVIIDLSVLLFRLFSIALVGGLCFPVCFVCFELLACLLFWFVLLWWFT